MLTSIGRPAVLCVYIFAHGNCHRSNLFEGRVELPDTYHFDGESGCYMNFSHFWSFSQLGFVSLFFSSLSVALQATRKAFLKTMNVLSFMGL